MATAWKDYEESAAELFRSLGMTAEVGRKVSGARGTHAVDVYVTFSVGGLPIRWIVECKHWQTPVTKLHVLALSEIVQDVGADRGLLLSETGFQAGAFQSARHTNITLSSLEELREVATDDLLQARLENLTRRKNEGRQRLHRLVFGDYPEAWRVSRVQMNDVLEPLAAWFSLELALNKAHIRDFPVSFAGLGDDSPHRSYPSLGDALGPMEALAADIDQKELEIIADLTERAERVTTQAREFLGLAERIIMEAERIVKLSVVQRAEGATLSQSLTLMKHIGALAETLRSESGGVVRQAIHDLWGILLQTVFKQLTEEVSAEEWAATVSSVTAAEERLELALAGPGEA